MTLLPRAILFDLDDTLISLGRRPQLLAEVAEEFAADLTPPGPARVAEEMEKAFRAFWSDAERHKRGRMDLAAARLGVVTGVFADLRRRTPGLTPETGRAFAARFDAYREEQIRFFPGAVEAIDELKRRGVKLALVTNGAAAVQRAKIERFDLAHRFDHIQIEGEAGFGKPEEQSYLHAMAALGVQTHETWMVGDNLEWEVAAPQRLGIHAIWHDHLGEGLPAESLIRPDRVIRSIGELTEDLN
ncbi:MAG: HAD family hydrolase [Phenylobacterium sp.]|uniref:HAD family hydrolase n=1 Tax=Phenylobacterium sp. TaxID=1871053 RepID=UPI0027268281|nr:HAD family hydrolase [Phenylobacterium sp.]MDO8910922.1 HAD family hydrolase [Phenylobacterium sp.]MDP3101764.1 HAD family hydrolase [Phenylobacterium sp.]